MNLSDALIFGALVALLAPLAFIQYNTGMTHKELENIRKLLAQQGRGDEK